jgi:two-component SAPR family response regulator
MIAIAVDDEQLMLRALVRAVGSSPDITSVTGVSSCEEALDFVENNIVDVAFLDINMRGMGGLALAEKILFYLPNCKIIFCTGYEEYAIPAFKLHASGYLLKPISAEDVQTEIDNIKGIKKRDNVINVRCFGNFEVFVNGETLSFKRTKTKELLAFLIDQKGSGLTAKQICASLFPDDTDDNKNAAYLRQLVLDLRRTLNMIGMDNVFRHKTPYYRIDTDSIVCDYFSYLKTGKPKFFGEYMSQYSWAEETCAMLQFKENYE